MFFGALSRRIGSCFSDPARVIRPNCRSDWHSCQPVLLFDVRRCDSEAFLAGHKSFAFHVGQLACPLANRQAVDQLRSPRSQLARRRARTMADQVDGHRCRTRVSELPRSGVFTSLRRTRPPQEHAIKTRERTRQRSRGARDPTVCPLNFPGARDSVRYRLTVSSGAARDASFVRDFQVHRLPFSGEKTR